MFEIADLAKLLDLNYIIANPPEGSFEVDMSTVSAAMARDLLNRYEAEEITAKVEAWLFAHGNICIKGHYGSADRERGFVMDYLEELLDNTEV